jgi:hypothetical protein
MARSGKIAIASARSLARPTQPPQDIVQRTPSEPIAGDLRVMGHACGQRHESAAQPHTTAREMIMTTKATTAALLSVAACTAVASANLSPFTVDQSELTIGQQQVSLDKGMDVDVGASHRNFRAKTVNGVTGVGIRGGAVSGEIDGTESITFTFDTAVNVTELQISFLYDNGQFGDSPAEAALIATNVGENVLQVTGPTSASWTGAGTVTNASVATEAGGGHWILAGNDIFGGAITSLTLSSGNPGHAGRFGDYAFVSLNAVPVPAPAGVGLAAGLGLVATRRRR